MPDKVKLRLIGGDVEGKVKGDHLEGVRAKQKGTTRSKEIRYTDKNKLSVIGGRRWSSWKSHEEKGFNQGIGKDGLYIDPSLSLSSIEDFLPANLKKHHQNQTSEGIHVFSPKVLNSLITALEKDAISLALRVSGFADDDISSWPQESESERDISRDKRAFGRSPERFIPCGWGGCYS